MTTNYLGSHVAYLGYAGCKVSVAGPKPSYSSDDWKNLIFFQNCPSCIDTASYLNERVSEAYTSFSINPWQAVTSIEWAQHQLGEENKLAPLDCLEFLSFPSSSPNRLVVPNHFAKKLLKKIVPDKVKSLSRSALRSLKEAARFPNPLFNQSVSVQTHLTPDELACLMSFSKTLHQHAVGAEIGSYLGASALATCAGFRFKSNKLFCIDTWMNNAMAYTDDELGNPDPQEQDTFEAFTKNISDCSDYVIPLRGWSQEVFLDLKETGVSLDWLFIDGDHSYEGVKRDWILYSRVLSPGALVIFHGIGWADGVNKVITELVMDHCILEHTLPNMTVFRYLGPPYWHSLDSHNALAVK